MNLKKNEILVLRTVNKDMTSHGEFKWPKKGPVKCDDWEDNYKCGNGLHGLPWGVGGICYLDGEVWLVVKVNTSRDYNHGEGDMVDKCKFRQGTVVYCGKREGAVALIQAHAPAGTAINYAFQKAGHESTQTAGNSSTQTAGYGSTQTARHWSTQTAGYESTQTAGYESTQTAGNWSTQRAGNESTQKAGNWSTQKAGYKSTQTAGDCSTQTAGNSSIQAAGDWSTQKAGINTVQIIHYDMKGKWRVKTRIITKAKADKWYRFENGNWRLCTEKEADEASKRVTKCSPAGEL